MRGFDLTTPTAIKRLKFADEVAGRTDSGSVWRSILQDFVGKTTISGLDDDLAGMRGLFWSHLSLSLTTLYFPESELHLAASGTVGSGIVILRAMDGRMSVRQRQWRIEMAKGDAIMLPADAALTIALPSGGRLDCAYLPGHALGPMRRLLSTATMQPIASDCLPLQLLVSYAGYLLQEDYQSERDADMLVKHFYDLLPLLVDSLGKGMPAHGGINRLAAIKAHVESNLTDGDFSISDTARLEGITERAIQKLFQKQGTTFSRYMLERRLELAKAALLLDSGFKSITQIALDVGFNDTSYFSRAFRKRYGMSPQDLRGSIRVQG